MNIFGRAKDRMLEQMALAYLNGNLLAPYGRATQLRIDTRDKTITMEAELKGETSPVTVEVTDYLLSQEGEKYFAVVKGIRTSREWLTALAENELVNVKFPLPDRLGSLLARTL